MFAQLKLTLGHADAGCSTPAKLQRQNRTGHNAVILTIHLSRTFNVELGIWAKASLFQQCLRGLDLLASRQQVTVVCEGIGNGFIGTHSGSLVDVTHQRGRIDWTSRLGLCPCVSDLPKRQ